MIRLFSDFWIMGRVFVYLLLTVSCAESNTDSAASETCEAIGVFETVAETAPAHVDELVEFHVTFDTEGRVHYCYFGYDGDEAVSYYGKDTGDYFFKEERVLLEESPVVCGGLAVARDGTPYLLSKQPASMVLKTDGAWTGVELDGLSASGAASALRGEDTVVSLSRAGKDGVFLSMSLGFQTANQPMYGAKITPDGLTLLFNGYVEDENPTIVGYGPQLLETYDDVRLIVGRVFQFSVVLADADLEILSETAGRYPRAAANEDGEARALYLNQNNELLVNTFEDAELVSLGKLGTVSPGEHAPGHLPWELTVDDEGTTHVLFEDASQGENALLYQKMDADGNTELPRVISNTLVSELPGNGHYAITLDSCGLPVAAIVAMSDETAAARPRLRIVQER